jgi:hypothetical protein
LQKTDKDEEWFSKSFWILYISIMINLYKIGHTPNDVADNPPPIAKATN